MTFGQGQARSECTFSGRASWVLAGPKKDRLQIRAGGEHSVEKIPDGGSLFNGQELAVVEGYTEGKNSINVKGLRNAFAAAKVKSRCSAPQLREFARCSASSRSRHI